MMGSIGWMVFGSVQCGSRKRGLLVGNDGSETVENGVADRFFAGEVKVGAGFRLRLEAGGGE
ncbi:MAG: hypothetical protein AAF357_07155 [Verrucomicrobiota bacterium]